jgi:hypothetical protein
MVVTGQELMILGIGARGHTHTQRLLYLSNPGVQIIRHLPEPELLPDGFVHFVDLLWSFLALIHLPLVG